jgi:tetratricopeptide (TPR) repeat protein
VTYWGGDWHGAQTSFERSLELCRELGLSVQSMGPIVGLGLIHTSRGDWETGRRYLEEHAALARQTGDWRWLHLVEARLAEWEVQEGRAEAARARLERTLGLPNLSEMDKALVQVALARACLALGDGSHAAELVAGAMKVVEAQDDRRALVEALQVQGMVLTRQSRWGEARHSFERVLTLTDAETYPYARAHALQEYGCMLLAKGDEDEARDRCLEALQLFETLGARKDAERAQVILIQLNQR